MHFILGLFVTVALIFSSCKSTNSSDKSIDNHVRSAGTELGVNKCGKTIDEVDAKDREDYKAWFSNWLFTDGKKKASGVKDPYLTFTGSDHSKLVEDTMEYTLRAVPLNLLAIFFETGNRIIVNNQDEINRACIGQFENNEFQAGVIFNSKYFPADRVGMHEGVLGDGTNYPMSEEDIKGKDILGCWRHNKESGIYEIHLSNKAYKSNDRTYIKAIEHSTVRFFGVLLTHVFAYMDVALENQEDLYDLEKNNQIKKYKKFVGGNKYFDELLVDYEKALKVDLENLRKGENADRYKYDIFAKDAGIEKSYRKKRSLYLMAEGFDSIFCSDATRAKLSSDFKETKVHLEILKDALVELNLDVSEEEKKRLMSGAAEKDEVIYDDGDYGSLNYNSDVQYGYHHHKGALTAQLFRGGLQWRARNAFVGVGRVGFGVARFAGRVGYRVKVAGQRVAGFTRGALRNTAYRTRIIMQNTRYRLRNTAIRVRNGLAVAAIRTGNTIRMVRFTARNIVGGAAAVGLNTLRVGLDGARVMTGFYPVGGPRWHWNNGLWREFY